MRQPTSKQRPQKVQTANFPAPIGGWIANRALANGRQAGFAPGAAVLDNFFPTSTGVVLRRGTEMRYSIGSAPVRSMFRYVSGGQSELFASIDGEIFDVSTSTPASVYTDGTNGDWRVQQITTAGGTFLVGVNGVDDPWIYDGTTWSALNVTMPAEMSDYTPADFSHVYLYANRLWFVIRDTMNVVYTQISSIAGDLTWLPVNASFTYGGTILFGQSWSLSSGSAGGLGDQMVLVSTEGEVIAFQGQNPADATSWGLVGRYRIGEPMGAKAFVRAGGDLLIATTVGLVSLAEAAKRDYAALATTAASYPIEEAWTDAVRTRGTTDWRCIIWPESKMLVVSPPNDLNSTPVCLVANSNTGAWCRFTYWDAASMEIFNGQLHYGDMNGNLWVANVSGNDDGNPYTGVCIPLFEDLGSPATRKVARNASATKRSRTRAREKLTATFDFNTKLPPAPDAAATDDQSVWGTGVWGTSLWGEDQGELVTGRWVALGGSGRDVSVAFQVSSNSISPLDVEIIRVVATFEICGVIS